MGCSLKTCLPQCWEPWKLIKSKPSFGLLCITIGLVTLPDSIQLAGVTQIVYQVLGIDGDGHVPQQTQTATLLFIYPQLISCSILPLIAGILGSRYGPAKVVMYLVPIVSTTIAAPVLLAF